MDDGQDGMMFGHPFTNDINFNNRIDEFLNNSANLTSTLVHEYFHATHLGSGTPENELRAYASQISHSSWKNTTYAFKTQVRQNILGSAWDLYRQDLKKFLYFEKVFKNLGIKLR
jgi:hypothetical protein